MARALNILYTLRDSDLNPRIYYRMGDVFCTKCPSGYAPTRFNTCISGTHVVSCPSQGGGKRKVKKYKNTRSKRVRNNRTRRSKKN